MTSNELRALFASFCDVPFTPGAISELQHGLQTAGHAMTAGADDDVVLAAALHDVGSSRDVAQRNPGVPHEVSGAAMLREAFGERAGRLVGAHVAAKRYLVTADADYAGTLSPGSLRSLEVQGGRMTPDELRMFLAGPWAAEAIALRRWDDAAKVPDAPAPSIDDIANVFERWSARNAAAL